MKITLVAIFLFFSITLYAQNDECGACTGNCTEACGPLEKKVFRKAIINQELTKNPYDYILHQKIKRRSTNFSTGSFIANNLIITAHHNLYYKFFIRKLSFCNKAVDSNKWVTLRKKDVKIKHYKSVKAPTDISVIKIKNPEKLAVLYRGAFELTTSVAGNPEVHLTGFPCDRPDTLIDKSVKYDKLVYHQNQSLIAYPMYTCTGDSGAPLWIKDQNTNKIIGIHHGGKENYFNNLNGVNISAQITSEVLKWIEETKK